MSENKSEGASSADGSLDSSVEVNGNEDKANSQSHGPNDNNVQLTADKSSHTASEDVKLVNKNGNEDTKSRFHHEISSVFRDYVSAEYKRDPHMSEAVERSKSPSLDTLDHITPSYEIGKHLRIIGDNLDEKYGPEFERLIRDLRVEAVGGRNIFTFMWLMQQFVRILKSSVNFPINLIKSSFQTLVAVWLNPGMVDESGKGDVLDAAKPERTYLEESVIKTYLKALMNEKETSRHIRLMVIGMFAAGKTSLVQNLLNIDKFEVESTDGIDIHINECFINEQDEWLFCESNIAEITDYKYRVAAMMNKSEIESQNALSDDAEVIYQRPKNSDVGKEVKKQTSVTAEAIDKTKIVLDTFRESDPILSNYWKDLYEAWVMTKSGIKGELKSSTQATVSVWDFAGQDVYYSTHHFFMNPASVYLLTMDISLPLGTKLSESSTQSCFTHFHPEATYLDAFKFWINSVHTYSTKFGEEIPTVIFVGTHIDQVSGTMKEKLQKGENYFDEALKSFIDSPVLQHIHPKKFFVNNTNPKEDFNSLRREILELGRKHKSWNQVVPARWLLLERSLEQLRSDGMEMVTVRELMEKDAENECPVGNQAEVKEFLRFHHSLGNLLYFDTESLEDHVILSPQWIVDAFRCFVTSFPKKNPSELKLWDDYENQAKLSPALLHSIINNNRCLADYKDEVVNYMEHLDIMAQPTIYVTDKETVNKQMDENTVRKSLFDSVRDEDQTSLKKPHATSATVRKDDAEETNEHVETEKLDFHIVPSMLSARPAQDFIDKLINPAQAAKTSVLCYVFSGEFLPPAIFHRLIAVCINRWPVSTRQNQFLLFRGLAVFSLTPTMELVIWMQDHVIYCRAVFYSIMGKGIPSDLCQEARIFIKNTLQELLGIYRDKWTVSALPFEECIHCADAKDPLLGLLAVKDLAANKEMVCKSYSVAHVIKSDEVLAHWYYDLKEEIIPGNVGFNTEVDLTKVPTEKELGRLSNEIGREYYRLGIELQVPTAAIQHCQGNHPFDTASVIFCVLKKWKEMNGTRATLDKLKSGMESVDCDMKGFYEVFAKKLHP